MKREKDYVLPLLVFVCAFLLMWYRAPSRIEHGFLWAEDVAIFITQAHQLGRHAFFEVYSGYWHFVPRLVAWLQMKTTPVSAAPYFFLWASALITAFSCTYLAHAFRFFSRPVAGLLALGPLLVPQSGETLLNITNIQWILFPVLLVLLWENLFRPPESGYFVRGLIAVAISLTGPFGVISLVPFILTIVYARRSGRFTWRQTTFILFYLAGVAAQLYAVKTHPSALDFGPRPYLLHYSTRLIREMFTGLFPSPDNVPTAVGLVLAIPLLFVAATSRARWVCLLLAMMAGAIWLLGAARSTPYSGFMVWYGFGGRYIYPALLFFFWAALFSIETTTSQISRTVAGALVVFILLASASRFEATDWPVWQITPDGAEYTLKYAPGWTAQIPAR